LRAAVKKEESRSQFEYGVEAPASPVSIYAALRRLNAKRIGWGIYAINCS